jgi:hypothetical protein
MKQILIFWNHSQQKAKKQIEGFDYYNLPFRERWSWKNTKDLLTLGWLVCFAFVLVYWDSFH